MVTVAVDRHHEEHEMDLVLDAAQPEANLVVVLVRVRAAQLARMQAVVNDAIRSVLLVRKIHRTDASTAHVELDATTVDLQHAAHAGVVELVGKPNGEVSAF